MTALNKIKSGVIAEGAVGAFMGSKTTNSKTTIPNFIDGLIAAFLGTEKTGVRSALHANIIEGLVLASLVTVTLMALNRGVLRMGQTFPELLRLPFARRVLL